MAEKTDELKKLIGIASDMQIPSNLRSKSVEMIGSLGTHEALLALLELAANTSLPKDQRELAIRFARDIIRSGH